MCVGLGAAGAGGQWIVRALSRELEVVRFKVESESNSCSGVSGYTL